MTFHDRVEVNPDSMLGKLVIRGTRITVELLARYLVEHAREPSVKDAPRRRVTSAASWTAALLDSSVLHACES